MSKRYQGGILGVGFNPLRAPNAPTAVTATGGNTSATVAFTAPANVGGSAITGYTGRSTPGNVAATASASPLAFSGLTNGTSYTFNVWALNSYGPSPAGGPSGSVTPEELQRALVGLGNGSIEYFSISTTGNAAVFGNMTVSGQRWRAAMSSSTRCVFAGGDATNVIDYVTIATLGNATDFGDVTAAAGDLIGCSNSTRGLMASVGGNGSNAIHYITIASLGNSTFFGQLTQNRFSDGSAASSTRGIYAGGELLNGSAVADIDYVTIASTGNATFFGNLTLARRSFVGGGSSGTRAVFGSGYTGSVYTNVIDYITIASTGNATDFGDLTVARANAAATSSLTRAVFTGGDNNSGATSVIDYITIASTGNATDFGDLTANISVNFSASNCHGGLS
jgi:hypothetical protein